MKRFSFIAYSLVFSALNYVFGRELSTLVSHAGDCAHRIASNTNTLLPAVTTAALATPPVFYALAIVFLGLGLIASIRPALSGFFVHAFVTTLIAVVLTLFVGLFGFLHYYVLVASVFLRH